MGPLGSSRPGGPFLFGGAMTSGGMMIFLIGFYVLTSLVSGVEGNWPRVLYWLSAAGITSAVLWGAK